MNGKPVKIMQYKVEDFMEQCVVAYKDVCGEPDMKLRPVETPFITTPDGGVMDLPLLKRGVRLGLCSPLLARS